MIRHLLLILASIGAAAQDLAIRAELLHTQEGPPIRDGVVIIHGGRITAVGPAGSVRIPANISLWTAKVAVPGLIDAHSTVGFHGLLNHPDEQELVDRSAPIRPELRAIDGYNHRDPLLPWLRNRGITTLHTGCGPLALVSGQTLVTKTSGRIPPQGILNPACMVAARLGEPEKEGPSGGPGTRAKAIALLRKELQAAVAHTGKERPSLRVEALLPVVHAERPLLVTAHKARDILSALALAREFRLNLVVDGASEAWKVLDQLKASRCRVILHPTMIRPRGETEGAGLETAARLKAASIPFAIQSGFEPWVPKTRVVLWEAAMAAANGLGAEAALAAITKDAAVVLGLEARIGSLAPGKDGDVAIFDGDPFEYTTRCVGTCIDGVMVSQGEAPDGSA